MNYKRFHLAHIITHHILHFPTYLDYVLGTMYGVGCVFPFLLKYVRTTPARPFIGTPNPALYPLL